jgi:hypothetical protein
MAYPGQTKQLPSTLLMRMPSALGLVPVTPVLDNVVVLTASQVMPVNEVSFESLLAC